MKKVIMGIIIGAVGMLGITTFADTVNVFTAQKATFDVYVNGEKFVSDKPTVAIDGSTYLPLKATGEVLGVDVNWNEKDRRVEIGEVEEITKTVEVVPEPTSTPKAISIPVKVNSNQIISKWYYYKSDILPEIVGKFPMITKDDENYLSLSLFGQSNILRDGENFTINLEDKEPVKIDTSNSLKHEERIYVKLSSVGLKARIEGDTVYLEWAE